LRDAVSPTLDSKTDTLPRQGCARILPRRSSQKIPPEGIPMSHPEKPLALASAWRPKQGHLCVDPAGRTESALPVSRGGHSAAWRRCASMIAWISERHDPQFVPACRARPIASTVTQPPAPAAAICLAPTPKQEHTVAPLSTAPLPGRPATTAKRARGSEKLTPS
jgi:hypothetical protein